MRERQIELDCLRGLALSLMVVSHSAVFYALAMEKEPGEAATVLWAVGETAPAWFFFAFGMTFDRLLAKSTRVILHRLRLFLYLAVVHNALVGRPVQVDFLAFLWLAQVVLLPVERLLRPCVSHYVLVWYGLVVSMLAVPNAYWDRWFRAIIPGFFPLLPWGLFVIGGLLYQRLRDTRHLWPFGAVLVVLSLVIVTVQPFLDWGSWRLNKLVLTAPYVMLLTGCAVLVAEAVRVFPSVYSRIPVVPRLFDLFSRNLLLATVLHYLPLYGLSSLEHALVPVSVLRQHHRIGVVLAVVASLAALVLAVHVARRLWFRAWPWRRRLPEEAVGIVGLLVGLLLWKLREDSFAEPDANLIHVRALYALGFVPVLARMALGMSSVSAGARAASRGPESGPTQTPRRGEAREE